jgi:hypothetical protein
LALAAIIGGIVGAAAAKVKMDVPVSEIPDELAYLGATVENPHPTTGLAVKHLATSGYAIGQALGGLIK